VRPSFGTMAATEEDRQKILQELKEKNDMILSIKGSKIETQVVKYYATHKANVAEFDKEGYLPLHHACEAQANATIIDKLLEIYPEGAKLVTKGEGKGDLPLHLACMKSVTGDTAKALAARIESVDLMIEAMVNAYPEACTIKQRGALPLHLACAHQFPLGAVTTLIKQHPDACKVLAEGSGNLPLHLACLKAQTSR